MLLYTILFILFTFISLCLFNIYRLFKFTKEHKYYHEENVTKDMNTNKKKIKQNQTSTNLNSSDIQTIFEDIKGYDSKLNNFEEILTTATQNISGNAKMDNQFQTSIDELKKWKDELSPLIQQNTNEINELSPLVQKNKNEIKKNILEQKQKQIKIEEIDNDLEMYNKKIMTVSDESIQNLSSIENEIDDLNEKLEKLQNKLLSIDYGKGS